MLVSFVLQKLLRSSVRFYMQVFFASFLLLFGTISVYAQQAAQTAVKVGEADLYPTVRLDFESLDNAFRNSENAVEATGVRVAPSAILFANRRGLEIKTGYEGAYASFSEEVLDYDDHHLFGSVNAVLGARKRLSGSAYVKFSHDDFGDNFTRGNSASVDEQVELTDLGVSTAYTFGAPSAKFNITGGLGLRRIDYQNREDVTQGRDYVEFSPFGRLSYRLSADTRVLLEVGLREIAYEDSIYDRSEIRLLTGLSFSGTGKSGGVAKIGAASSSYEAGGFEDRSVLTADINLYTLPSKFSRIDLNFARKFDDLDATNSVDGSVQTIDDFASVSWRNQWSGFVASTASLSIQNKNRDCPTSTTKSIDARFDVSVKPRQWVEIGLGFSNINRTADICEGTASTDLEFEAQKILAFLKLSL